MERHFKEKGQIKVRGNVEITLRRQDGTAKTMWVSNLVVDNLTEWVANVLGGVTSSVLNVSHIAVGSGTTAPASTDVQLESEFARKTADVAVDGSVVRASTYFTFPEAIGTISELGLFANATDTANSGTLLARVALASPVTKTSADTLTVAWTISIAAG